MDNLPKVVPAILAALLAVALFAFGRDKLWGVLATAGGIFVLSLVSLLAGRAVVGQHLERAVWLIDAWLIGLVILNAAIVLIAAIFGGWISDQVAGNPNVAGVPKAVGGLVGAALAAGVTILFANDGTNSIWPAAIFRRRLGGDYKDRFANTSLAHQAVYEQHVAGTDPVDNTYVDFQGWGLRARHRRARIICHTPSNKTPGGAIQPTRPIPLASPIGPSQPAVPGKPPDD